METICPKCHSPRTESTDFCVCGHKWDEYDPLKEMFSDVFKGEQE